MSTASSVRQISPVRQFSTVRWVSTTYFAEGLPFMLVCFLFAAYLTDIGAPETWIGYANILSLPWSLKAIWAPAVDVYGTKRTWLLASEGVLCLGFGILTAVIAFGPTHVEVSGDHTILLILTGLLAVISVFAATHDVAIDGYYMEAIPSQDEQAAYTGLRSAAYQVARIFARSGLMYLAGAFGWVYGFGVGAAFLTVAWIFHLLILPQVEVQKTQTATLHDLGQGFLKAFAAYLKQPSIGLVLALLVTYKLGDQLMFSMNTTFMMREVHVSKANLAWIGLIGTGGLTGGALLSAWAIKRFGWEKAVWPLTLGMNLNIWLYVWLASVMAHANAHEVAPPPLAVVAAVYACEQFAGGLGASVLVVFSLRSCQPGFNAAHFAIATAISSLGSWALGGQGGWIVAKIGYTNLYLLSFAAAIPSMILLAIFLRRRPQAS